MYIRMTVLLVSVISLCSVVEAMVTAFEALDTTLKYLTEAEWHPTPLASVRVTWHTLYFFFFLYLECKKVGKTIVRPVTAHLYGNCIVLFSAVLCSCYRICVWSCSDGGMLWRSWLRHCASSWKVTGSIPNVIN